MIDRALYTPSAISEDTFCIHLQLSVKILSAYTFSCQWRCFLHTPSAISEDTFCMHLQLSVKMLPAYTFSYQWRYFLHTPSAVSEDAFCIHLQLSVKMLSAYTFSYQWKYFLKAAPIKMTVILNKLYRKFFVRCQEKLYDAPSFKG